MHAPFEVSTLLVLVHTERGWNKIWAYPDGGSDASKALETACKRRDVTLKTVCTEFSSGIEIMRDGSRERSAK